jgi:hypothetical protein
MTEIRGTAIKIPIYKNKNLIEKLVNKKSWRQTINNLVI